jgi:cytochrome c553
MKRSARTVFPATCAFVVSAAILGHCSTASAQLTTAKPGDELRPLYVTSDDIADGKRLAQSSCAACHGGSGISSTENVPHLAGQRSPYLYLELKGYQAGLRTSGPMNDAVKFLSDDALAKVAAYFANLDPASPDPAGAGSAPTADPIEAGKAAAAACAGCHGETGVSKTPGMPSLTGLDPQYLIAAMKAYRGGQRKDAAMQAMLAVVSDADVSHIALFYALQKPARAQTPAPGDGQAGKAAATSCAGCHGDQGVSGNPATPSLAGQDAQYFAAALRTYKNGSRADETMKGLAAALDDNTIKNLSAYYAALQPQPVNVRRPLSGEEWAQRCDRCHGVNGNSTNPRFPALAAQRADYLEKVLHAYKTRARRSPEMAAMSDGLTDDDIKNLAAHYSRQKARAVVFITVPSK